MKCPFCAHLKSKVTDKRSSNESIRRRRECLKCKRRFTTYEQVADPHFYIIKKDQRREKFSREKLERGVYKAFEKRPVPEEKIKKMISEIEEQLKRKGKKEITSSQLGDLVMKKIKKIDNVAYIRFASVYKNFKDVVDFKQAIKQV